MGVKEDIVSNFECFNIVASEDVISKCKVFNLVKLSYIFEVFQGVDLCSKYNMTAEELVDQWFAYTSSMLRGAAPTVKYLGDMERKELARRKPSYVIEDQKTYPFIKILFTKCL